MDQKQKGPFLGNIVQTYKRQELVTAILQPSKTLAQGFKTNIIVDLDGRVFTGYIAEEASDKIILIDAQGKEHSILQDDVEDRRESLVSSMPEDLLKDYTIHDLASIVDFLESLSEPTSN